MKRYFTRTVRLSCEAYSIDLRLTSIRSRWLASADAPSGVTLGVGYSPAEALIRALEPFEARIEELLDSVPEELLWERY
jgi:hypothetical protein